MAKPKLKRQGLLGQFLLGTDPFGAPVQTTVPLDSAYTRTHQGSGLVIGGRSAREFYHPIPQHGVIYNVPGITIYRWINFSLFSGNDWSSFTNGLTVDGIIDPSSPRGDVFMTFTLSDIAWPTLGVPIGADIRRLDIAANTRMTAPLPQFVGFDTGDGNSRGNIDDLSVGYRVLGVGPDVGLGSIGSPIILGQYDTGYVTKSNHITFSPGTAPSVFDILIEILWGHADARFNLQALQFTMHHTP